ncbi:MAG: nucleotide exchange factor GrpE, partial [Verrucomicrobiota bacterium]|nr:nucleotide exchange factor GrpE [Verrucomicrobiota bacterium]
MKNKKTQPQPAGELVPDEIASSTPSGTHTAASSSAPATETGVEGRPPEQTGAALPCAGQAGHEKKDHGGKGPEKKEHKKEAVDERLLRVLADFDNFRKRTLREKMEIYRSAQEDLLREMLPVMDHLDMALAHAAANGLNSSFADGLKIIVEQMAAALNKFGVSGFDAQGQAFDPNRHDAVAWLPAPGHRENTVVRQIKRGYALGEKVIRPAQVIVAQAPLAPGPAGADNRAVIVPSSAGNVEAGSPAPPTG